MKEFLPQFTSGTKYDGFKLGDKSMLFTKQCLEHCPKKFAILFDINQQVIKLDYQEGKHTLPKNGKYQIDFTDLPMPRGRYTHVGDEIYKLLSENR